MAQALKFGGGLAMPLDVVTRASAIIGQRGTGKTSTAVVLVEEAMRQQAQVAVIDPTGAWYGLRSSADGKHAGLEVVVFGGHNGDVPLSHEAGAEIARLVTDEGYSVVLDLELMTKGKQQQFVAEFCTELYHRNRNALLLVADEAHRFAPQASRGEMGGYGGQALGALTDVVTLGRRKGLGAALISQRPAKINKDVFEQAEVLFAHKLMGPNDRKQIAGWLEETVEDDQQAIDVNAVRRLKVGEAVVYAPVFEIAGKYAIRRKRTFDSSATPEVGVQVQAPRGRADIDMAALEAKLGAAVEAARADDPVALRNRINELERQARDRPSRGHTDDDLAENYRKGWHDGHADAVAAAYFMPQRMADVRGVLTATMRNLDGAHGQLVALEKDAADFMDGMVGGASPDAETRPLDTPRPGQDVLAPSGSRQQSEPTAPSGKRLGQHGDIGGEVPKADQKVLDGLAWLAALGVDSPTRPAVAWISGAKNHKGGTFKNKLSRLKTAGLIIYPRDNEVALTHPGRLLAADPGVEPTRQGLHDAVLGVLPNADAQVLIPLLEAWPSALSRETLADATGGTASGGTFKNKLSRLKTPGLITYPETGLVKAADILFP